VTSVVLGKDVVPRIGLHQLEALRHNLIYAIHKSEDPKVRTIVDQGGLRLEQMGTIKYQKYLPFWWMLSNRIGC
jgi:hypothetical protein